MPPKKADLSIRHDEWAKLLVNLYLTKDDFAALKEGETYQLVGINYMSIRSNIICSPVEFFQKHIINITIEVNRENSYYYTANGHDFSGDNNIRDSDFLNCGKYVLYEEIAKLPDFYFE
jgi:hypothetical protein